MNKNVMKGMLYGVIVLVLALGVYWYASGMKLSTANQGPGVAPPSQPNNAQACTVAVNLAFSALNTAKTGTGVTTTATLYDINGNVVTTSLANNTNFGVSGYSTYTLLVDASNYFADKVQFQSGCNGNVPVTGHVAQADTSATISYINNDGVTINAVTSNESVGVANCINPTFKLSGATAYAYVTSPTCQKYIVTLQYKNVTAWDTSVSSLQGCVKTGNMPKAVVGTAHEAFECSTTTGVYNWEKESRTLHVCTTSTGQVYGTANDDTLIISVYPEDILKNSISGAILGCAVQDDAGTVAQTAITSGGTFYMR